MVIVNEVDVVDADLEVRVSGVMRLMILGIESESENRGQKKMERVIDDLGISNDSCSCSYSYSDHDWVIDH